MTRLAGKVAFITGATSGVGRASALAFACEGASVVVTDVAGDGNRGTARKIEQAGSQALAVACDGGHRGRRRVAVLRRRRITRSRIESRRAGRLGHIAMRFRARASR